MLHGMINEQGHCLDVRDDISEKNEYFYMFSSKLLVTGAFIIEITLHSPWVCTIITM